MRAAFYFLALTVSTVYCQICSLQDDRVHCNCQTGVEPINNELADSSVNAVILVKCSLEELKLPDWVNILTLENYESLNSQLPTWPNVSRIEIKNPHQHLILKNETFKSMPNLKQVLIEGTELNIKSPLMLFHTNPVALVNLTNVILSNSEGSMSMYTQNFTLSSSTWNLSRMKVALYASSIQLNGNEIPHLSAGSLHLEAAHLNLQGTRFNQIEAHGLIIKATDISIVNNRFDINRLESSEAVHLIVAREHLKFTLLNNTWSSNFQKPFAVMFPSDSISPRKSTALDDYEDYHDEEKPAVALGPDMDSPRKASSPKTGDLSHETTREHHTQQPSSNVKPPSADRHSSASSGVDIVGAVILTIASMLIVTGVFLIYKFAVSVKIVC